MDIFVIISLSILMLLYIFKKHKDFLNYLKSSHPATWQIMGRIESSNVLDQLLIEAPGILFQRKLSLRKSDYVHLNDPELDRLRKKAMLSKIVSPLVFFIAMIFYGGLRLYFS